MTATYDMSEEDEVDEHGIFYWTWDSEGTGLHAFVRSFAQMKPEQTLSDFYRETAQLFQQFYIEKATNITGPMMLVAGSLGT